MAECGSLFFKNTVGEIVHSTAGEKSDGDPEPAHDAAEVGFLYESLRSFERKLKGERLDERSGSKRHDDSVGSPRWSKEEPDADSNDKRHHGKRRHESCTEHPQKVYVHKVVISRTGGGRLEQPQPKDSNPLILVKERSRHKMGAGISTIPGGKPLEALR